MSWFEASNPMLPQMIELNARWRGSRPALIADSETLGWAEFDGLLKRAAGSYAQLDIQPGDHVAFLMNNSVGMLAAMLGAVCGGYVAVPLNVSVGDADVVGMLRDCDARLIVASDEHVARLQAMRDRLPAGALDRLVALNGSAPGWHDFDAMLSGGSALAGYPFIAPERPCNIIYSSGTTDLPKGIVHSHACRMAWARDLSVSLGYYPGARSLVTLGLYSNITWVLLLNTILCGGTIVLQSKFSADDCLETIQSAAITHTAMVPVQLKRLLSSDGFGRYDTGSLRSLMCCGSPLDPELKLRVIKELTPQLIELYGLTEGLVTIQEPADAARFPKSVGRPSPGQDIRIIDDEGNVLGAGESGEIVGIGRLMMSGYHNRQAASESATWLDAAGRRWLRTGDIGYVDEQGNLYIVDRKKDMILSGGQNIYPADIEAVMRSHPDIADVAVIGVRSEDWGETPLAVVVSDTAVDELGLLDWTNARVGKQQRIRGVRQVESLPRNPNGKILKRALRQQFDAVSY